jgi:hypothetical protein
VSTNAKTEQVWGTFDSVPWGDLRQAHGSAERVPEAIRALAAAQPDDVEESYWRLDNVVVLQGSVFEAAFYVIPYMLAIIDSDRRPENRAAAYDLLVELARGTSADPQSTVIDDAGQSQPLIDASIERIARGRRRYEEDLQHGDPLVRRKALDLLTSERLVDDPARLLAILRGLELTDDPELAERVQEEAAEL